MTTAAAPAETATSQALQPTAKTIGDVLAKRGIDEFQWNTLRNSLFPGAKSESVLLVIDYCKARKLDPMKKPCHIVPMKVKDQKSGEWEWRDVVMPGIYEYRITAHRTGQYLGHTEPVYGPDVTIFGVEAPAWCAMTMKRWNPELQLVAEFPVKVHFKEVCATKFDKDDKKDYANDRWSKAPIQMLTKCCEAAGLREAFPDEFGGEPTAEEMEGKSFAVEPDPQAPPITQPRRVEVAVAPGPDATAEAVDAEPVPETSRTPDSSTGAAITITKAEKIESSKTRGKSDEEVKRLGVNRVFYFLITDSTGRVSSTWSEDLYLACGKFADEKTPVDIATETVSGQQWPKLVEVSAVKS